MSKFFKITLFVLIISLFVCSLSFATDIDLNLTDDYTTTGNSASNFSNTNSSLSTNTTNKSSNIIDTADSLAETTISSVDKNNTDDGLGLSNVLNILLIVVGVVLILLAIAILIRLHG